MTTETLTPEQQAMEDFLAEEVSPPEPEWGTRENQPLSRTLDGLDLASKVGQIDKGRYVRVWNTRTGAQTILNVVHLPFLDPMHPKAWKWEDGKMMFSRVPVKAKAKAEGLLCMLHDEHPNRAYYDSIGIANIVCTKRGIPSLLDVERHMQKRHKDEWGRINRAEEQMQREQDRQLQRAFIEMATANRQAASDNIETAEQPTQAATARCEECGEVFTGQNVGGANLKRMRHVKSKHGEANDA